MTSSLCAEIALYNSIEIKMLLEVVLRAIIGTTYKLTYSQINENRIINVTFLCSVVFWIGDLNYRLSDIEGETAKRLIQRGQIDKLLEHDQVLNIPIILPSCIYLYICIFLNL